MAAKKSSPTSARTTGKVSARASTSEPTTLLRCTASRAAGSEPFHARSPGGHGSAGGEQRGGEGLLAGSGGVHGGLAAKARRPGADAASRIRRSARPASASSTSSAGTSLSRSSSVATGPRAPSRAVASA